MGYPVEFPEMLVFPRKKATVFAFRDPSREYEEEKIAVACDVPMRRMIKKQLSTQVFFIGSVDERRL
jgi:hypothetical protein